MFNCEKCNKSFSTIYTLNHHLKTTKSCKDNENNTTINQCQFCNKNFTCEGSLNRHLKSCKIKNKDDSTLQLIALKKEYDELYQKYQQVCQEKIDKDTQIKLLEEKVNIFKDLLPTKHKKPNTEIDNNEDGDPQSQVNIVNGKNVYITQNQIYIDKVNSLTPINDLLARINQDTTLYNKITSSVEDLTNFIDTEISKCVLFKNIKKLMVCYRFRNENDQIISLVDNLETVVSLIYFDQTFASRIEEIYKVYDREVPIGDDTNLLELNNSINIFSHFLKADEKNQKIKEGLFKKAFETITKKANTLRQ